MEYQAEMDTELEYEGEPEYNNLVDEIMEEDTYIGASGRRWPRSFGMMKPKYMPEKMIKADGQPTRKRGPKPDTRPAMTRRQELNRQAQRTHRERKEQYIKALEQEMFRLKQIYGEACRERDEVKADNAKLRDLLVANNIAVPDDLTPPTPQLETASVAEGSVAGNPDTSKNDLTPQSASSGNDPAASSGPENSNEPPPPPANPSIDYNQIGIDFVLALEQPCMDHTQMLCAQATTAEGTISGHALMATCPPASHLEEQPQVHYPHKLPDMNPGDLKRLLDLSSLLPLYGEVTPVMAWTKIVQDPRHTLLNVDEFVTVQNELMTKIRCYGFGAVLEEFEVRDAMEAVLEAQKDIRPAIPRGRKPRSAGLSYPPVIPTPS